MHLIDHFSRERIEILNKACASLRMISILHDRLVCGNVLVQFKGSQPLCSKWLQHVPLYIVARPHMQSLWHFPEALYYYAVTHQELALQDCTASNLFPYRGI